MGSLFTGRDGLLNLFGLLAMTVVMASLVMAFLYAPTDLVQGEVQRIFYVHVPMAWLAYLAYGFILVGSIGYLWKRDFKWDRL
ncbi:MAG: cytochrome c biogenesis protein CcsA, partial [Chloroflexota bacterium]